MKKKTNAARILERFKIEYEILEYEVDENDLSAENVAVKIEMPLERVFKTLVARGDRQGVLVVCVPGGKEVDLKRLASVSGNKRVEMVALKEVLSLTGYIRGGVSPIGMKKKYPTYIDESAFDFQKIVLSAGQRGYQLVVDPNDLCNILQAVKGDISK